MVKTICRFGLSKTPTNHVKAKLKDKIQSLKSNVQVWIGDAEVYIEKDVSEKLDLEKKKNDLRNFYKKYCEGDAAAEGLGSTELC